MEKRIVFTGKGELKIEEFSLAAQSDNQVTVRTICSLISTGTELIVLNRMFDPGTHWDNWIKYPFYPGYAAMGEIIAAGKNVSGLKPGDKVVHRGGHASAAVIDEAQCFPVPDSIKPETACWFALAKIAAMSIPAAHYGIGSSVAVIGAGPVGQMASRWALSAGAEPVILIDTVPMRLEMARRGGAVNTICATAGDAIDEIKKINNGNLPDVVIDSTGHAAVFANALKIVRSHGRLVLLGDTGSPGQQHLSPDVIMRGLTIAGAHDIHENDNWNSRKIISLFFQFCQSGRFNVDGLISHRFSPADCVKAYATAGERRAETMGLLFDWSE
ncbi:MAG: zinc-binding dehydrogenase [Lentisphaerota bacterium]|jgi:2-desacetyl-2-hydroxyethyl bacteriochlorophyllide A dehydrogenase